MKNFFTLILVCVMPTLCAEDAAHLKFPVGVPVNHEYSETSGVEMPFVNLGEKTLLSWEIVVEKERKDGCLVVACTLKDAKVYLVGKALFSLKKKIKTAYAQLIECPLHFVVSNQRIAGQPLPDEELEAAVQIAGFRGKLLEFLARTFALKDKDLIEDTLYEKYEMIDPNGLDYLILEEQDKEQNAQLVRYIVEEVCDLDVVVAVRAKEGGKVLKGYLDFQGENALECCGYSLEREYANADYSIKWPEIDGVPPIENVEGKFTVLTSKNDKQWYSRPCFPSCHCGCPDYGYLHCYN